MPEDKILNKNHLKKVYFYIITIQIEFCYLIEIKSKLTIKIYKIERFFKIEIGFIT